MNISAISPSTIDAKHTGDATDEIPIVLLHGLGATADTWSPVANEVCARHRVVAFDLRGHGESDAPETGYDLVTLSEDIISAMAVLGMGQVVLVAHGWGARVALVLAARHPALLSHLVLVDCPHVEPRHWPGMTRERFLREQTYGGTYDSCADFLAARKHEMAAFWSPDIEHILLHMVRERDDGCVVERLGVRQQQQIRAALWEDRALPYYSKLSCPVMLVPAAPEPGKELPEQLVHTDEFALAKGHMAQQVAAIIPRCTVLWMPDTAHDVQLQHPTRLAQAIMQFIKQ
jgi:pimeloyl-ACP methyl ester carboxylesterase